MNSDSDSSELEWPPLPDFPGDAFKETATFYADYRPPYPRQLLDDIAEHPESGGPMRLLDLGCGPGRACLPLASRYDEVWAVDPEQEMLDEGARRTPPDLAERLRWIHCSAEALSAQDRSFRLVTIGEAFHRMDQRKVASLVRRWLVPGGRIAIIGYMHIWSGSEQWKRNVCEVRDRYKVRGSHIAPVKRIEKGAMTFEGVLRSSGFHDVVRREYQEHRVWSIEEVLGYLYSISVHSKRVLGNRVAQFEEDVRQALRAADPNGLYHEEATFESLSAVTPPEE